MFKHPMGQRLKFRRWIQTAIIHWNLGSEHTVLLEEIAGHWHSDTGGRVLCSNLAELRTVECFGRKYSSYACDGYFSSYYNWEQWIHCNFLLKRDYLWGCSAGWLPAGWLALSLMKSLFTSCQNSIFLSHQSAGTVFFSPAEQALHYYWQTINPDQQWARRSAPIFLVVHNEQRYFTRT